MGIGAKKYLTIRDGRSGVAGLAKVVHGQQFEFVRTSSENGGHTSTAGDIKPFARQNPDTPMRGRRESMMIWTACSRRMHEL
jgi:hypothetical protein